MRLRSRSASDTGKIAAALAGVLEPGDVVVLAGDLGAGKTTFVQGAARALGSDDVVTSPTFAIVQEYASAATRIAHVDAYRLERVQELHDIGLDELFDGSTIVFVEWGDRVASVLPDDRLTVTFTLDFDAAPDTRMLTVGWMGATWSGRAPGLQQALAPFADEGGGV